MDTNAPLAADKYTPISVSIIAVLVVAVYATMFRNYRVILQLIHHGIYHFPIITA